MIWLSKSLNIYGSERERSCTYYVHIEFHCDQTNQGKAMVVCSKDFGNARRQKT
jgi:hypothetical protein